MYKLYIDESGKNTLTKILSYAPHFAVAGVMVHDLADDFIKRRADQIKFKYWGGTKITFHTNDMRNLKGDFSIFKGQPDLYYKFQNDFKEFIRCSQFKLLWVGTNKISYLDNNPPIKHVVNNNYSKQITTHEKKLTQNTFRRLWEIYLSDLVSAKTKQYGWCAIYEFI